MFSRKPSGESLLYPLRYSIVSWWICMSWVQISDTNSIKHTQIISNSIYAGCRVTVHSWLTAYFKFNCQCLLEYLLALKFCHKIHVLCADICHTNSIIKVKAPMRVSYATLFHWHISFAFFRRRKYIQALKSLATWLNSRLTDRILLDYFPFLLQTTNHLSHSQDLDMFRKTWINA